MTRINLIEELTLIYKQVKNSSIDIADYGKYQKDVKSGFTSYQNAVQSFSDSGGKGFYDIAISIPNKSDDCEAKMKEAEKQFLENGLDIVLFDCRPLDLGNAKSMFTYLMPSSQALQFKQILVDEMGMTFAYKETTKITYMTPMLGEHFYQANASDPLISIKDNLSKLCLKQCFADYLCFDNINAGTIGKPIYEQFFYIEMISDFIPD